MALNLLKIALAASIPSTYAIQPKVLCNANLGANSPTFVAEYIRCEAQVYGVDVQKAIWIVGHESQFGANMRGDDGNSRGYWMINKIYHPEVSDQCADDLACSTHWSLNQILNGKISEWSTWKYCKAWYKDCPF